jgi:hypothetical protein
MPGGPPRKQPKVGPVDVDGRDGQSFGAKDLVDVPVARYTKTMDPQNLAIPLMAGKP